MDARNTDVGIDFLLNGEAVHIAPEPGERLVEGDMVCACLMPVQKVSGRRVDTLSGLVNSDPLAQALAERFQDHGAAQCGVCTPGMMVCAVALLRETPTPSEAQVQDALGGVLCRCTGYRKIIDAVRDVPATLGDGTEAGVAMRRVDGIAKVMGKEVFGDDVAPGGTLEIRVVRSPFARAAFSFGDLEAWKDPRMSPV